jgi:hypothetical protein
MTPHAWISILFLLIASHSPELQAASIRTVPEGSALDGTIQEWTQRPPTLSLIPKFAGARPGRLWLAQSPQGLLIAGKIGGDAPNFAKNPEDMPNGDHVEIWIALADKVPLPPIGAYSSMDGITELHSLADCEDDAACKDWFARQDSHRRLLPHLFVRQWQMAPNVVVETYAKPAFEGMDEQSHETYQYLFPRDLPKVRFAAKPPHGYEFEALIPWRAMPPSDRLNLDRMRVLVDVFSPGGRGKYGEFSTTSGNRLYGVVDDMNEVSLTPTRRWHLSPCRYPLAGKNFWARVGSKNAENSKFLPAYFLPTGKEEITTSFVLDNDWIGRFWAPTGISPVIVKSKFFSHTLSPGLTICGPDLAVRYGNQVSYGKGLKIEPSPTAKKVPGGWLVVGAENGTFRDPEGQCGACEEKSLNLHFVSDTGASPRSAFHVSGDEAGCCRAFGIEEITLSDDFKRVRVKEIVNNEDETKETNEYCLDDRMHVYLECAPDAKKGLETQSPMRKFP